MLEVHALLTAEQLSKIKGKASLPSLVLNRICNTMEHR
jgi:hypothetical protein